MPASGLQTVFAITHSDPSIAHIGSNAITEIEVLPAIIH